MSQETSIDTKDRDFINQEIKISATYGGNGGKPFSSSFGSCLTEIKAFTNSGYALAGLHISYNNGECSQIGGCETELSSLHLDEDSIARMYVQTAKNSKLWSGSNIGVNNIYIETVKGVQYASTPGTTPLDGSSTGWSLVSKPDDTSPCQNLVLVGMSGRAGSGIDALGIMYKEDVLLSRTVDSFDYSDLVATPSTPINVATATVHNQTDEEQEMSLAFEQSVSSSYTWTVGTSLTLGASAKFKTGVPLVAKGEVTVSAEVSFTATFGETHTTSDAFSYTAMVKVPGTSGIIANAVASSSSLTGNYTARYVENWAHAGLNTSQITGAVSGLTAYNVEVDYADAA